MRLKGVISTLLCFSLAGCSSSLGGMESWMTPTPSQELTGSIKTPPPPAAIRQAVAQAEVKREVAKAEIVAEKTVAAPMAEIDKVAPVAEAIALAAVPTPVGAAAALMRIKPQQFRDAKPINFGKSLAPKLLTVHGVDVSRWQGDIDWLKLRGQGANFAFIKATDGGDHVDPMFKTNWRGADAAGLKRGAYHFFYWCRTAGEQADWFIRNVPRDPNALPPVIDVEYNGESSCKMRLSKARIVEKMTVFMNKLEAYYGQRPIIYTAPDFYKDNLEGEFLDYPFWLRAVAQHPSKVYPGRKWVFWQYSGSGLSHGVEGKIDLNAFYGSEKEWHAWLRGQSTVARAD
ncbi:MAG: glycosyl hydrolase [Methylobacterium mesophilicum]|nr:glycosyl hydrolase [Methylobacterium mesophilicum]